MITPPKDAQLERVSDYSSAALCGGRVRLRDADGYDPSPSTALLKGSGVHELIDQHLSPDIEWGEERLETRAANALIAIYRKDTNGHDLPVSVSQLNAMAADVASAFRRWREVVEPKLDTDVLITEQTLYASIDGTRYLQGTPDAIHLDDARIYDWKTAAHPWTQAKADAELQPPGYALLVEENYGVTITEFVFVVYSWADNDWSWVRTQIHGDRVDGFDALMLSCPPKRANFRPQSGLFNSPRGWWCKPEYCNAWDICAVKHVIEDGKAGLPALSPAERLA